MNDLNELIIDLINPYNKLRTLLHKTNSEDISKKILETGFTFTDNLINTTDYMNADKDHLNWWYIRRKAYGDQIVVIQFDQENIYKHIKKFTDKNFLLDHMMSYQRFFDNDEEEFKYTLPKEYVKGYIDESKGKININKAFNPSYVVPDDIVKRNVNEWI